MIHPAACTCVDCCHARVDRIMSQTGRRRTTWYRHIPDKIGFGVTFGLISLAYILVLILTIGMGMRGHRDAVRKLAGLASGK